MGVLLAAVWWPAGAFAQSTPIEARFGGTFCLCHVGSYVAWQKGFYEKHGVKVREYVFAEGGTRALQGLLTGDIDVYVSALHQLLQARAQGRDIRVVGSISPEIWALVVRSDLKDRITRAEDLRGRTIGVSSIGAGSWAFAVAWASLHGLDPQRDIRIVPLGGIANIITALKAKRVDAAVTWEPGTSEAVLEGVGVPMVNLLEPRGHQQALGAAVSLSQVVAFRSDVIQRNPELVRRVIAALDEALAWMARQSPEVVAEAIRPVVGSIEQPVLVRAIRETMRTYPTSTRNSRTAYRVSTELLAKTGAVEKDIPFDDLVDCRFVGCDS